MQPRKNHFNTGNAFFGMYIHRHATAIVGDTDRTVFEQHHIDLAGMAGNRFVNTVIDNFLRQMIWPGGVGVHAQQWLYEKTGKKIPRIKGGYKALRQFLLQQLDAVAETMQFVILSGRTGTGKTLLLDQLEDTANLGKLDLEKLYHHRGSVFGKHVEPQPSQIDIENTLAIQLLKFQYSKQCRLLLEDESPCIGARRIPDNIVNAMRHAPILLLETDADERIDIIFDEYITQALSEYINFYGEEVGFEKWTQYLTTALDKIQRRLGGKTHAELKTILHEAVQKHRNHNNSEQHREWIARLLFDYYDPMYDYQLNKKSDRIIFNGNRKQIIDYAGKL